MLWLRSELEEGIAVRSGRQILGRGQEVDIDIHLPGEGIGLRHLELRWHEEILTIAELESGSGTTVNGDPISGPTVVLDGDEIGVGSVNLSVEIPAHRALVEPEPTRRSIGGLSFSPSLPRFGRSDHLGRVFLVRHHRDGVLASRLSRLLSQCGWSPWLADAEILGGTDWVDQTVIGLRDTEAVVVLLTGRASASEWVERQVIEADEAKVPILLVVVGGVRPGEDLRELLDDRPKVELATIGSDLTPVETALRERFGPGTPAQRAGARRRLGRLLIAAGVVGVLVSFAILVAAGRTESSPAGAGPPNGAAAGLPSSVVDGTDRPEPDGEADSFSAAAPSESTDGLQLGGAGAALPILAASVVAASIGEALRRNLWLPGR